MVFLLGGRPLTNIRNVSGSRSARLTPAKLAPTRRVYDCFLFNGEVDVLSIRLNELNRIVDVFVIVESNQTFSGAAREISFNPCDPRIAKFAFKIRHVIVTDMPETNDPLIRKKWQRNAVLRGTPDAKAADLLVLSDVDEIPRATLVVDMAKDQVNEAFGFRMALSRFYVNYLNISGPRSAQIWTVAATRRTLDSILPDDLRYAVQEERFPARIYNEGGWHFSHLRGKIGAWPIVVRSSNPEFSNRERQTKIKPAERHQPIFDSPGCNWKVISNVDLSEWLLAHRSSLRHLFYSVSIVDRAREALSSLQELLPRRAHAKLSPIVICPYLYDSEADEVKSKFGLDGASARHIEFYLWQDTERIGPELAFEHCWNQFPNRDIIIVHSDMAPRAGDPATQWYDALVSYRDELPTAGMIACNLLFPKPTPNGAINVQCAGGTLLEGRISHLNGGVDEPGGVSSELLTRIRSVEWVTFGGLLIRRELIRACGSFDRRYEWAYVMDVDYCFEARLRGFQLMQVPVALQHEENRTTRSLWEKKPELRHHIEQNLSQFYAKWKPFYPAFGVHETLADHFATRPA
jgi:hypothetical protein